MGPCTSVQGWERALEETKGSSRQAPRTHFLSELLGGCGLSYELPFVQPRTTPLHLEVHGDSRAVGLPLACEKRILLP